MPIESATYPADLNSSYPTADDAVGQGDDHLRLIKLCLKNFVGTVGDVSLDTTLAGYVATADAGTEYLTPAAIAATYETIANAAATYETIANVTSGLALKVNKAGDTMTGLLTLSGDPSTALQAATKQYVDNNKLGWELVSVQEPTTEVNSITFTGLSTYKHWKGWYLVETDGIASIQLQGRATAGTWRTIDSYAPLGSDRASWGVFDIQDAGLARPKGIASGTQIFSSGGLVRDDKGVSGGGDSEGVANDFDVWDELRITTSDNIKGTTLSERAIMAVYGHK